MSVSLRARIIVAYDAVFEVLLSCRKSRSKTPANTGGGCLLTLRHNTRVVDAGEVAAAIAESCVRKRGGQVDTCHVV